MNRQSRNKNTSDRNEILIDKKKNHINRSVQDHKSNENYFKEETKNRWINHLPTHEIRLRVTDVAGDKYIRKRINLSNISFTKKYHN